MKYEYLKLTQIIILSLVAINEQNIIIYVSTLLLALLSHSKYWVSSIGSILLVAITLYSSFQAWKFAILGFMAVLALLSTKFVHTSPLPVKYIVPVFLLIISFTSINQNYFIRTLQLLIFFYFILLTYYAHQTKLKSSLYICNAILIIQGIVFSIQYFFNIQQFDEQKSILSQNTNWWYFMTFPFSIQCASLIIQSLKGISNLSPDMLNEEQNNVNKCIEIQMTNFQRPNRKGLQRRSQRGSEQLKKQIEMEDYFRNIEVITDNNNSFKKKEDIQLVNEKDSPQIQVFNKDEDVNLKPAQSPIHNEPLIHKHSEYQSQSLNMILILPFLAQSAGILQLPLYIYLLSIHYQKHSPAIHFITLLTIFIIVVLQTDNPQNQMDNAILLRTAIVLLVNKNIHVLNEVTQIVKKIWLRSSFVLVLAFLFWFSLKTVNVFHIILTIILLIFISAKNQKNEFSYRHKYWIYLLSLFNIFVIIRQVYHLLTFYGIYKETQILQNILDLAGISHQYQEDIKFFNFIPAVVSVFLGFQYLTYESVIYNLVRQRPILPIYQQKINQVVKLFTIVYYKLIPWLSYAFIFFVILALQFSCTSLILLMWLLVSIAVQVQRRNDLRTYEILYSLWNVLERLFAIQIILRYAFEFLNFPMFYAFFHKLPFFSTIEHYKEFLGLAIREGDYVYFKAITKFQVMVGLDFICIFICFLVIEYYTYLIAYNQIENPTSTSVGKYIQKEFIKEIYTQFIDFKLTVYFKNFTVLLKRISKVFLWLYYPLLGIYCCLFPSIITLLFLLMGIRFYLRKNSESYDKFIRQNLITKVKQMFTHWKEEKYGNTLYKYATDIYQVLTMGKKAIRFDELINFENLRKYMIFLSSLGIVLHYASRVFILEETEELFGVDNKMALLRVRWIFYVGGASIDSRVEMIQLLFILGSTILEVKCTRFLLRLYDLSARSRQEFLELNKKRQSQVDEKQFYNAQKPLYVGLLQKDEQKEKQLQRQLQQMEELQDADYNPALKRHIQTFRQDFDYDDSFTIKRAQSQFVKKPHAVVSLAQGERQSQFVQLKVSNKEVKKFIEMKVSLMQGTTKFIQRCFVMVLVFLSIVENRHPFGIVYLVCSMVLTFLGAYSILNLSRVIASLIVLEYVLLVCNYANYNIVETPLIQFREQFQSQNTFQFISTQISKEWQNYLTFGDSYSQVLMMILSYVILFCLQLYFQLLNNSSEKILDSLAKKMSLSKIEKKIYQYSNLIYTYFLIYSPLCITICSLGIYLLDFTITNLFLTIVSILFLFKSVLIEEYSGSRQFWRLYFYILQFFILIFMLIYDILSIPMYQQYCIKILCSSEEFHTKLYKAGLLFVLQIGIDLTKSSYFISALDNLKLALSQQVMYSKLAIAYKENDRKINKKFKEMNEQNSLENHLLQVGQFLDKYKTQPDVMYHNKKQITLNSDSWIDILLQILPSFVDSTLVLTSQQARQFVARENEYWLMYVGIGEDELDMVSQSYLNQFAQMQDYNLLMEKITEVRQKVSKHLMVNKFNNNQLINNQSPKGQSFLIEAQNEESFTMMRKSFSQNRLPYQAEDFCRQRLGEMRESLIMENHSQKEIKEREKKEKKKLLFLLFLQSTISNWHYLTYFFLILEHLVNLGLLTLPFPLFAFCYGLIYSYQAPKNIWRLNFLFILLPISFKFSLSIGLLDGLSEEWVHMLIGDHPESIWLQYMVIMFVLVQCLILKIIGLYDQGVTEVESMKLALVRNIINNENQTQISHLSQLLKQSLIIPQRTVEFIFCRSEQKAGYSYTTLMTSLQLMSLFFVFFFYDQMAIRKQVTIYQMISYNQFTAGMVILTLIQLAFILIERFVHISDFKEHCTKWELNLILKYLILIINLIYTELLVLIFFPLNSNNFTDNSYISIFYIINALVFLVSCLQIKYGIDQKSKGFMDRYTWYNGFVYMGFRAVPFLFEFKVFSDWTFTKTALRLFDWIKLQEIFGRMYIAKCNSIFLQGKVIGSKIQWWKKLLMGFPLLFAIILLIFGPLILFSNLNPLASKNSISAGYLQLCLKVNRTNEYVFYTNSHITDIVMLVPNEKQKDILSSYDIEEDTVQVINLEEYSDQYWEISQGSYLKLLEEPSDSLYEIVIRMKFERNQTGSTPTYTVNTYQIPQAQIQNFKETLQGNSTMILPSFLNNFLRLDNNNGIHFLGEDKLTIKFYAKQAKKSSNKKYWIIENGLNIKIASDKYTKAIFGYSVMSFYISIILVIANYFRFLFQGSANTIILNDIPFADPVLSMCNGVYKARYDGDTEQEERLFWLIIDLLRSPDEIKSLTGSYLDARIQTKRIEEMNKKKQVQDSQAELGVRRQEQVGIGKNERQKKND